MVYGFFMNQHQHSRLFSAETMFSIHSDWLWKELKEKRKEKLRGSPKGSEVCLISSPAPIKKASSRSWQERQKVPPITLQFASKWSLLARLQLDASNKINRFQKCSICCISCVVLKKNACIHLGNAGHGNPPNEAFSSRTDWSLSSSYKDTSHQSVEGHWSEGQFDVLIKGGMFFKQQIPTKQRFSCFLLICYP